jgi:hypothetical protein
MPPMDVLIALVALVDRFDPRLAVLLEHFRDSRVPLRLSAAIVATAAALLLVQLVWGAVAGLRLCAVRRLVRARADAAAFARDFRGLDAALSSSIVAAAWREYRACLRPTDGCILAPSAPHDYIALHAIAGRGFPARFFAAAHGYFTGVGLLLTFVGLVAALKFAAAGVASPDIAVATQALDALLGAASFKFTTSIAGLGCSLLLSAATRMTGCAIEGAVSGLASDLQRLLAPLIAESLAYDQLEAARAQSAQLEKLATRLTAIEVRSSLPAPEPAASGAADAERLARLLHAVTDEMRASAGGEIKQLAAMLSQVGAAIGQTQTHIGRSGEAFADRLGEAAFRLADAAAVLERSMEQSCKNAGDELARRVDEAADRLVAGSDVAAQRLAASVAGLDSFNAGLQPQIAAMREIASSLATARQALDDSADTWSHAAAPVVASVEASRQIAADLAQVGGRVSTAQRDMATTAAALTRLSEHTSSLWDNYRGRFEKVDGDLQAVFEQLQGGTRAFGKEVIEFVGRLDASLAESMQALSIGTEELREVAELLVGGAQAKAA